MLVGFNVLAMANDLRQMALGHAYRDTNHFFDGCTPAPWESSRDSSCVFIDTSARFR